MPNEATLAFIEHNILLKMEEGINKARNKSDEKKTIRNDKINRTTTNTRLKNSKTTQLVPNNANHFFFYSAREMDTRTHFIFT